MLGPRSDYTHDTLEREDLAPNPLVQLRLWVDEAIAADVTEPSAMCLATVYDNFPFARMVLMRGIDDRGITFFTNYESMKAEQIERSGVAAVVFWWPALQRQARFEGEVERVSAAESDAYFVSRPRESQLASAASPQSTVIESRAVLEARVAELDARFPEQVPRPDNWGGYRILPRYAEFWQGRSARLHDRFRYEHGPDGWVIERLAP